MFLNRLSVLSSGHRNPKQMYLHRNPNCYNNIGIQDFDFPFQANVGDSRCIASRRGAVEQLSYDHKPSNEGNTITMITSMDFTIWLEGKKYHKIEIIIRSRALFILYFSPGERNAILK